MFSLFCNDSVISKQSMQLASKERLMSADNLADDLGPLFEAILRCIPEPRIEKDGALQMLMSYKLCCLYSTCHLSSAILDLL